jgi:chaperonin GroES
MATTVKAATQLKPLGDRLVIRPTPREEMTKSGIVLPDTAKERPQEGTILAVGPGRTLYDGSSEPIVVSVGEMILFQ